jgi:enoyl-CoA hydratase
MVLTGRPIEAGEALGMGLIDRIAPPGGALDAARDLARSLTGFPQACLRNDLRSTRPSADDLTRSLRREWRSVAVLEDEGYRGAGRFAAGAGRGGAFDG